MATPAALTQCPYPGLRAFFTEERDWYFGREAHVDAMLTCLESNRFLAIVGSSGSGKSSLVFAGLIPALREGQLAGTRTDAQGEAAPWSVVCFHPGNHPLEELAGAIVQEARAADDPHLAGYVRAALDSGDLIQALGIARLLDANRETLVYIDQFEELFRFSEKSGRVVQENALRLSQLLVAAAGQKQVRLHLLLSMRSEFIGECERFPGLPELVSQSQFLAPRLNRKQLEQSLACPARTVGWSVGPNALTALLNDCGNSYDQLPLAQHVLRRMWARAAAAGRHGLTVEDYTAVGGIRDSMAQHGDEILAALPKPQGEEIARVLFMALCEQREEGPLVRRLSSQAEVEALAGGSPALVAQVIAAFAGDDPGFIREDKGLLDVRHEAVLRQWPRIAEWRLREVEARAWLDQLAKAARAWEANPAEPDYWLGPRLRRTSEWMEKQQPSAAWAARHGIASWDHCVAFFELSRAEAGRLERARQEAEKKEAAAHAESQARGARERRQRRAFGVLGVVGAVVLAASVWAVLNGHRATLSAEKARQSELRARHSAEDASRAAADLSSGLQALVATVGPSISNADWAIGELERHKAVLLEAIKRTGKGGVPPTRAEIDDLANAYNAAVSVAQEMRQLSEALGKVEGATIDQTTKALADDLEHQAQLINERFRDGLSTQLIWNVVQGALWSRIAKLEAVLNEKPEDLPAGELKKWEGKFLAAAGEDLPPVYAIREAALALHLQDYEHIFNARLKPIEEALRKHGASQADHGAPLRELHPADAIALSFAGSGRVNRVRFAPAAPPEAPVIVTAYEGGLLRFWAADGKEAGTGVDMQRDDIAGEHPRLPPSVKEIAFNPLGEAAALAIEDHDRHLVPILRWTGSLARERLRGSFGQAMVRVTTFAKHTGVVTDVAFGHSGELVASAGADKTVRVFDARSLAQLHVTTPPLPGVVTSVAFNRGDNLVVSGCADGGVRVHTVGEPKILLLGQFPSPALPPGFSYDGKFVLAGSADRTARFWSVEHAGEVAKIEHPAPVTAAVFRPVISTDSYVFITTAANGEVRLNAVGEITSSSATKTSELLTPRHTGAALSASWSNDGTWLATVGGGEVFVWRWINGALVAQLRLTGLHAATSRAEFSPAARWLVTYGGDQVALLWDLQTLGLR